MQPLLLAVCAPLWIAAALCVPSVLRGRRRLLFWVLVAVGVTMTLQPHVVYNAVDPLLGGVNVTYFIFHATAIIAIALLDALVREAVTVGGLTRQRKRLTSVIAGIIVAAQALLFFGGDWHYHEQIHTVLPDRWDFATYSATTWVAMALLSLSVGTACLSDLRRQRRRITRVSLGLVAFGCLWVLVYAVVSLVRVAVSIAFVESGFEGWPRVLYNVSLATAPISLALGLGLTAGVDSFRAARKSVRDRVLLWRITPLWTRLLADSPELSIERDLSSAGLLVVRDPGAHLYRRYVEVRDSMLLTPGQPVSADERLLINQAEDQFRASPASPGPDSNTESLAGSATRQDLTA